MSPRRQLSLTCVKNGAREDIEMGVLPDHRAYLTARGLAKVCGVAPSGIIDWTKNWTWDSNLPRDKELRSILEDLGFDGDSLVSNVSTPPKGLPSPIQPCEVTSVPANRAA